MSVSVKLFCAMGVVALLIAAVMTVITKVSVDTQTFNNVPVVSFMLTPEMAYPAHFDVRLDGRVMPQSYFTGIAYDKTVSNIPWADVSRRITVYRRLFHFHADTAWTVVIYLPQSDQSVI